MTVQHRIGAQTSDKVAELPTAPGFRAGISLTAAGSMVFSLSGFREGRARFLNGIGVSGVVFGSHQVHSRNVVVVDSAAHEDVSKTDADAMVTNRRDAVLTYLVADCLPIFLADTGTGAFSLVHSGWKGTGIVTVAIQRMVSLYGSRPQNIQATIGPGIGVCCYRVPEQRGRYFEDNFGADTVIWDAPDSPRIDMRKANINLLEAIGVQDITVTSDCTFTSLYLGSFRRNGETHTRMLAFMCRWSSEMIRRNGSQLR